MSVAYQTIYYVSLLLKVLLIILIAWSLLWITHRMVKGKRKKVDKQCIFINISRLQTTFLSSDRDRGKPIHTEHWKVLISCKSRFLWTSYLMFWHCYPCKCSARCLWILRALFCTWIVRVVGDHLILRRWWLTHACISGYAPLWCQQRGGERESDQKRKDAVGERWRGGEREKTWGKGRERRKKQIQRDR